MPMIDTPATKATPWIIDGEKAQQLRQARGISYGALADSVGVSADEIYKIESGGLQPDGQTINRIARQLGVYTADIMKDAEDVEEPSADAAEVTDTGDDVQTSVEEFEIPDKPGGWKRFADADQRLRLHAAREAAEILRETRGYGPFSVGGVKSVDPADVIQLAQWIVHGQ